MASSCIHEWWRYHHDSSERNLSRYGLKKTYPLKLLHGIGADTTGEVWLEERKRTDEGLMGSVIRAKFQDSQEGWQHATIVGAVGAAHDRLDVRAIEGAGGFP